MPAKRPLEERFWEKVNKGEHDECWEWTASLNNSGYGQFNVYGRMTKAHRVSYELANGPLGELFALHSRDNRKCVNPKHLFAGTNADNMADMAAKGRHNSGRRPVGAAHGRAKLTDEIVHRIRAEYAAGGISQRRIAEKFGISQGHVCDLTRGRKWLSERPEQTISILMKEVA
jgi:predicted XRE-type DNA-binding protein